MNDNKFIDRLRVGRGGGVGQVGGKQREIRQIQKGIKTIYSQVILSLPITVYIKYSVCKVQSKVQRTYFFQPDSIRAWDIQQFPRGLVVFDACVTQHWSNLSPVRSMLHSQLRYHWVCTRIFVKSHHIVHLRKLKNSHQTPWDLVL